MSLDSQYHHRQWDIEGPTLAITAYRLELLLDFDSPSHFTLPPNCPQRHGITPHGASPNGATLSANTTATRTASLLGRLGGVGAVLGEDPLVTEWKATPALPLTYSATPSQ